MYGIFTYIYHKNQLNVGKYTSHMDPMGKKAALLAQDVRLPMIFVDDLTRGWTDSTRTVDTPCLFPHIGWLG